MGKPKRRRKSDAVRWANRVIRNRTTLVMGLLGIAAFGLLLWKLYDLQIRQHDVLQERAVAQQTRSTVVTASRGTIYDKNGDVLAISATAETIAISPREIKEYSDKQDSGYIARGLSRILEVDADRILEKMEKNTGWEILKSRVEQDVADQVRSFINGQTDDQGLPVPEKEQKRLYGIYLDPDSKRYYPYRTLAAQVIGFVGAENSGLYGLEAHYNDVLEGISGLTVTAKTNEGLDMPYHYAQYYDAQDGNNLVLTLDINVQDYLEKGLESMVHKFDAKNGAAGIIMDVNTGGILAMASVPTYDLNDAWTILDTKLQATLEGLEEGSEAYQNARTAAQLKQWRSKCINDTYEPGSTFKPITLSAALEEGKVTMNSTFHCGGSVMVPGWSKPFYCSNHRGHGTQDLKVATGNSCNPAFISMGLSIGTETYYKYLRSYGLMEKTGIDLDGEVGGIFANEKSFNSNVVSLASYAFGQTFNVTPLELIRAQAATINGGYLRQPYLVEQITDGQGAVTYQHDSSTAIRQVVSQETSDKVRECLEYVVASGTGKNGQVVGYRIGGKTGTADKTGTKTPENPKGDIVVSFMCFAPADDPQYIMLLTMDTPSRTTGTYPSGGNMVAPTASAIMSEVLPYLGIEPDYTAAEMVGADVTVPNVVGLTADAAKEKLSALGFACQVVGEGANVTDQTPAGGAIIPNNAAVILYLGQQKPTDLCTVPNVVGKTASEANTTLTNAGLILRVSGATSTSSGNAFALSQSIPADTKVEAGTVVTVQLGTQSSSAD